MPRERVIPKKVATKKSSTVSAAKPQEESSSRLMNTGGKWKPIYIVSIYRMVRLGMSDKDICSNLDVTKMSLYRWKETIPELREAIAMAEKEKADQETLPAWIYSRLSPTLQALWDRIEEWSMEGQSGIARIELMLQDHGKKVRQTLFLHALCMNNFSPSKALAKVNLTKTELQKWIDTDIEFAELVEEMDWHKGNFFEEHLCSLVSQGNPGAVIFANKTYNGQRGYGTTSTINHNVQGSVLHGVVDLGEIMGSLSDSAKLELLEAIRKREEAKNPRLTVSAVEVFSQQVAEVPET